MKPENLSIKELIFYGQQHDDAWVKRLASVLWAVSYHLPEDYLRNEAVEDWFEEQEREIKDMKWEIEDSESTINDQQRTIDDQEREIRSLRFDLQEKFKSTRENSQISGLKSALVELQEQYDRDKNYHRSVLSELEKTQKAFKELQDKYNVWQVIAN